MGASGHRLGSYMRSTAATLLAIAALAAALHAQSADSRGGDVATGVTYLQPKPVFAENRGQFGNDVLFRTVSPAPVASVTREGLVLTMFRHEGSEDEATVRGHNVRLRFVASAPSGPAIPPHGTEPATTLASYFIGSDEAQWVTGAPCWESVTYESVASGVAVELHGRNGLIEYDVHVAPGVSSDNVQVAVDGATEIQVQNDGSLLLITPLGSVRQLPPQAWEIGPDGSRRHLDSRVNLKSATTFGFQIAGRDPSRPLVIDPGLVYSTFVEGSGAELGDAIAVDAAGCTHVAGSTSSNDFPATPGAFQPAKSERGTEQDIFVTKLDATGSVLIYATYLGGTSSNESVRALVLDTAGQVLLAGQTHSADFPTTDGAYSEVLVGAVDGFVTKLSADGTALVFSSLFGGSTNSEQSFRDIAVDSAGRLVLAGNTSALDLPITPNAIQTSVPLSFSTGFIVRMSPDASSIDYCTYVGCYVLMGIAVDANMGILAVGHTSAFFGTPVTPGTFQTAYGGSFDAFVIKLSPDGALDWCSLIGGAGDDRVNAMAVDAAGRPIVVGRTSSFSNGFPTTPNAFQPLSGGGTEPFVTKLAADGSGLAWSTHLGGWDTDNIGDVVLGPEGTCYVLGFSRSPNAPVTPNAIDATLGGTDTTDSYLGKLSADGTTLLYGTLFGGPNANDTVTALAVDAQGNAYFTGYTLEPEYPTTAGGFDTELSGSGAAFVVKIDLSTWTDVGQALPNGGGVSPRLMASGTLQPLSEGSLHVDKTPGNSLCVLVLGLSEIGLPFKGGVMVPVPHWIFPFLTNAQGELDLVWPSWPAGVPTGTELWFQAWIDDANSLAGFTASNGLTGTTP
ncbi:MAG: DUF7948 domain-containing protein [Planctomycetota bacterium]